MPTRDCVLAGDTAAAAKIVSGATSKSETAASRWTRSLDSKLLYALAPCYTLLLSIVRGFKVSAGLTSLMVLRQGGGCRQEESVEAGMGGRGEGDWPRRGALPGAPTSPAAQPVFSSFARCLTI